ncbi:MAG: Hsp20/alpha crystallin family protein [Sphingobacteriales bacterium]|nr:MAG: Hsp20/alpha crystallin family protein [Sphingobacteriales bacterium]
MYNLKSNYNVTPRTFGGLFEEMFNSGFARTAEGNLHFPLANIQEDEAAYTLHIAAPGLKKENFKVQLDKNLLHISYEHKAEEQKEQENKWLRTEFKLRSFKRTFTLTNDKIKTGEISASYTDGILVVSLPKKEKTEQPVKEITIN